MTVKQSHTKQLDCIQNNSLCNLIFARLLFLVGYFVLFHA